MYVEQLEQQVQELKSRQIPAQGGYLSVWSRRVDALMQENAALRRLLHAIGIDERGQQQYLDSTSRYSMSETKQRRLTPDQRLSAHLAPLPVSLPPADIFAWQDGDTASIWNMQTIATSPKAEAPGVDLDEWLLDLEGVRDAALPDLSLPDPTLLANTYSIHDEVSGLLPDTTKDLPPHEDTDVITSFSAPASVHPNTAEFESTSTVSCVMNASIPVSDSDSTTLCSVALSMVFRHNKKQLTMAELDERLQCGFRPASEPSQGCRVENHVLFNVLAEICT